MPPPWQAAMRTACLLLRRQRVLQRAGCPCTGPALWQPADHAAAAAVAAAAAGAAACCMPCSGSTMRGAHQRRHHLCLQPHGHLLPWCGTPAAQRPAAAPCAAGGPLRRCGAAAPGTADGIPAPRPARRRPRREGWGARSSGQGAAAAWPCVLGCGGQQAGLRASCGCHGHAGPQAQLQAAVCLRSAPACVVHTGCV
jgi:hypothetical protein